MEWTYEKLGAERKIVINVIPYLPDDIVVNIVSLLPAEDVLRCRCVCRAWRDLTSTQEFADIHLSRQLNACSILVNRPGAKNHYVIDNWWDRYVIDNWWEPQERRRQSWLISSFPNYGVKFSHGGLIVFKPVRAWNILNPVKGESVMIRFPRHAWNKFDLYGVFFHPLVKEYCTLWRAYEKFELLVMCSKAYMKVIGNPSFWKKERAIGSSPPILVKHHLYWMAAPELDQSHYDIIEFDIKSEDFTVIPSPVPTILALDGCTGLLNNDGLVCLVHISIETKLLTIWTHGAGKLWTSTSCSISSQGRYIYNRTLRPIAFAKGELFFRLSNQLFVCNLKSMKIRSFMGVNFDEAAMFFFPHVSTVASLTNSRSGMTMATRSPQIIKTKKVSEGWGDPIEIIWTLSKNDPAHRTPYLLL